MGFSSPLPTLPLPPPPTSKWSISTPWVSACLKISVILYCFVLFYCIWRTIWIYVKSGLQFLFSLRTVCLLHYYILAFNVAVEKYKTRLTSCFSTIDDFFLCIHYLMYILCFKFNNLANCFRSTYFFKYFLECF